MRSLVSVARIATEQIGQIFGEALTNKFLINPKLRYRPPFDDGSHIRIEKHIDFSLTFAVWLPLNNQNTNPAM